MVKSLRLQLVLWLTLGNTLLLVCIGLGAWVMLREIQNRQINDVLQLTATQLAAAVDIETYNASLNSDTTRLALVQQGMLVWFVNSAGQVDSTVGLAARIPVPNVLHNFQDIALDGTHQIRLYYAEYPGCPLMAGAINQAVSDGISRFLAAGSELVSNPPSVQLQNGTGNCGAVVVGFPLDGLEQTSRTVLVTLGLAILGVLLFSAVGGLLLANRAFKPIADITARARRISQQTLSERIVVNQLPAEVQQLAQTFDDMLARLQAAFEHEHQFAVDMSHELRTPLGLLKAQLSLALRRPRSAEALTAMMQEMETDVDRMTRLVDALLTLMRTQSTPLELHALDLSALLEGLVSQLEPLAAARQLSLLLQAPPQAVVHGDHDSLVRLFLNLLDNALKYSMAGQIRVCITGAATEWQIDVTDSGVGISPDDLQKVFSRFYRATATAQGVGLGLSIVQAIVHQHGGRVTVQSQLGQGSTFTVFLPRA